jgi:hypothetical protein
VKHYLLYAVLLFSNIAVKWRFSNLIVEREDGYYVVSKKTIPLVCGYYYALRLNLAFETLIGSWHNVISKKALALHNPMSKILKQLIF